MRRGLIIATVVGLLAAGGVLALPVLLDSDELELVAEFDTAGSLVPRAHVRVGDVPVGTVRAIELTDDHRARVTMQVDREVPLPSEVVAVLRMTSLLGERYVDLVPVPDSGGQLTSGEITRTGFESDLEGVVTSGDHLLAAVSADALAQAVTVGARTFADRGLTVGALLDDLGGYVDQLATGSQDLEGFLDASTSLLATLAPDAERTAAALDDLADLTAVLAAEEERLVGALDDLRGASERGAAILGEEAESIDAAVLRLRQVTHELLRVDQALENLLLWLPRHNLHVPGGVVAEFSQVIVDFSVCGVTDDPDDPSNSCDPSNPGLPNDPPPNFRIDECALYHVGCTGYPEGIWPYRGEIEAERTTPEERARKAEQAQRSLPYRGLVPRPEGDRDPRREAQR